MVVMKSDLEYLLPRLRLQVGDLDGSRYTDDWLNLALIAAFDVLQNWWNKKYIPSIQYVSGNIVDYKVERTPGAEFFYDESLGVIEPTDNRAIVLMAAIMTLSGFLEQNAWAFGSWKDFEVSVSNIEGGRILREKIKAMYDELESLYRPPSRRLSKPKRKSLDGYIGNILEYGDPDTWA